MDRDTSPIGGLRSPLQPTTQLFHVTIVMDVVAVSLSMMISTVFAAGVLCYILASRAYSYRGIRLKKYPVLGYLTVIIFQGAIIFYLVYHGSDSEQTLEVPILPMLASSALIGGYYPLTQVYQHEEDLKDGVRTLSYVFGVKGTFLFCGIVFAIATVLMFFTFRQSGQLRSFYLFILVMLPMLLYFLWWMQKVWKDRSNADFRSSLTMNILASVCTSIFFATLLIRNLE